MYKSVRGLPNGETRMILGASAFTWYRLATDSRTDRQTAPLVPKSRSSIAEHDRNDAL